MTEIARAIRRARTFMKNQLARLSDFVFGYDFFISYKHADGENYPGVLEDRLRGRALKDPR